MSTSTPTDETTGSTLDDRENYLVTDGGHVEPIDVSGGNAPRPDAAEPTLEAGARVVDREQPPEERSAAVVLELPGEAAAEFHIDAIGETVADVNPQYDRESPVALIAFEDALETHGADDVRRYSYPSPRLKPVGEEWEPARSSGARERREILDDHGEAVDAFGDVLEALLTDTATVATRLLRGLKRRAKPETRGACRHSKNDEYRPENDDALCCWECSTDLPRPKKFDRDDAAGSTCRTGDPDVTRAVLADWMGSRDTSLPDPAAGVATDYRPWRFASDLKGLGSDTDRIVRTSAVRLAWNATLDERLDEEYNYQRAVALLRDRGIDTDALLPGGDGR